MSIRIQNELPVLLGNVIVVPGCEPTSALTSPTLAANRECYSSIVELGDALDAVPGSSIRFQANPTRLFFVLPDGPPPPHGCKLPNQKGIRCISDDHYQRLRDVARPPTEDEQAIIDPLCDSFNVNGTLRKDDDTGKR